MFKNVLKFFGPLVSVNQLRLPQIRSYQKQRRQQHSQASIGSSEANMADGMQKDWRELCVEVTNEKSSTKLILLIQELIEALDMDKRSSPHTPLSNRQASARE